MLCPGAFLAGSCLNAFLALFLGAFAHLQWACSVPLVWWLLVQLLSTLPPGVGAPSTERIQRAAIVELALSVLGLVVTLVVASPIARLATGLVSTTILALELLPLAAPQLAARLPLLTALGAAGPASQAAAAGSKAAAAMAAAGQVQGQARSKLGGGVGEGGGGGAGAWLGPAAAALPTPMSALMFAVAAGKLLQARAGAGAGAGAARAATVAAVSSAAGGRGSSLLCCTPALASALWSFSSSLALYGIPLALACHYGLLRYAASMLLLGGGAGAGGGGAAPLGGSGAGRRRGRVGRGSSPGSLLSGTGSDEWATAGASRSVRRNSAAALGAGGGMYDSDSDGGQSGQGFHLRLLELGELYPITESE
ncbi:hypothetical protein GPECTOR_29g39 [Gonium pectorale]|uniref:Uncharacterized protein n=1 Tax=Gonium pectorale TaxID=33097 RepID=A0A150GG02_GONPE|nr:hypothetical protein GPECTOR_29g39 [Gonium pectorale]|eukprot:KXZ48260.1 hypothetical protein GPECTOR_29g39 [Gonium pectorale]